MTAARVGPERGGRLLRELPMDLSAAWLAAAVLYFLDAPDLPEPWVALLLSTAVGVAGAVIASNPTGSVPGPAAVRAARPASSSGSFQPRQQPAVGSPAIVGSAQPTREPSWFASARGSELLDFQSYAAADELETQCPNCGRFEVHRESGAPRVRCRCSICRHQWTLEDSVPPPDVIVRSWLSAQGV